MVVERRRDDVDDSERNNVVWLCHALPDSGLRRGRSWLSVELSQAQILTCRLPSQW